MSPGEEDAWLWRWIVADSPSEQQEAAARSWISGLDVDARQDPSRSASPDHPHPGQGELRSAYLIAADVFVIYTVDESRGCRLLFMGRHPPAGLDVP